MTRIHVLVVVLVAVGWALVAWLLLDTVVPPINVDLDWAATVKR